LNNQVAAKKLFAVTHQVAIFVNRWRRAARIVEIQVDWTKGLSERNALKHTAALVHQVRLRLLFYRQSAIYSEPSENGLALM
jgi:hypothetical protein